MVMFGSMHGVICPLAVQSRAFAVFDEKVVVVAHSELETRVKKPSFLVIRVKCTASLIA
jgi:hypothetical protein